MFTSNRSFYPTTSSAGHPVSFLINPRDTNDVVTDTVADESRKKMADGVARSPSRLCSRDGKICCYGDALSTIFLLACFCALLPTFRFSFFFSFFSYFFPASRYIYLLRVPSSVLQPSATLSKSVFYNTCSFYLSFVPYPISEFFCFLVV